MSDSALSHIKQLADSQQPKILMLTHALGGGVARHLVELSTTLQRHAHILQLKPCSNSRKKLYLILPSTEPLQNELRMAFSWPEQRGLLWRFIAQLGVTQIHVHHVLGWPDSFWTDLTRQPVALDLTLHDHCIFSAVELLQHDSSSKPDWLVRIQRCFTNEHQTEARLLLNLAANAQRIFTPSQAMYSHLCTCFPALDNARLQYHPHPEAEVSGAYAAPFMRNLNQSAPMRILCLGMLSVEKGAQTLARVARHAKQQDAPIEFHLLGSCHVHLPPNIHRHGSYKDEHITALVKQINPHLLWLPAECPETWSYTLSTGLKAGLPVLATNIGVFPERLQQRPLSWLCPVNFTVSQWLGILLEIRQKHLTEKGRDTTWCSQPAKPFYSTGGGYVIHPTDKQYPAPEPLTELQIRQAVISGLPEARHFREQLIRVLLIFKHSTFFAPLVRLIPYHWQRKLKRFISRAPLHEPPR